MLMGICCLVLSFLAAWDRGGAGDGVMMLIRRRNLMLIRSLMVVAIATIGLQR